MVHVEQLLSLLLSQSGDTYVFGAETDSGDENPDAFDCSELFEWAGARLGVTPRMPDGSKNQQKHCEQQATLVPVEDALRTRGALLFRMTGDPTHVVVTLGDGTTIEAKGAAFGVGQFVVKNRGWTHGALFPGIAYEGAAPEVPGTAPAVVAQVVVPGRAAGPDGRFPLWKVFADGAVHTVGGAPFHGSLPSGPGGLGLKVDDIVDLLPDGEAGYWLAGADGSVFSFGGASFWGSLPALLVRPASPIHSIQPRPDGRAGYVLVAEDDATFAFPTEQVVTARRDRGGRGGRRGPVV